MSKSVVMFSFKLVVPGSPCSMLPQICKKMWRQDNDFDVVNVSPPRIFVFKDTLWSSKKSVSKIQKIVVS